MVITRKADYQGLRRGRRPKRDWSEQTTFSTREADRRFSISIRERDEWTCRRCHGDFGAPERREQLTCSHFVNIRHASTRYDPLNCVALCVRCHTGSVTGWEYQKHTGGGYRVFMVKWLGPDGFQALIARKQAHVPLDVAKADFFERLKGGKS